MIILPSCHMANPCHSFAIARVNTTRQVFIEIFWSLHREIESLDKIEQRWALSSVSENLAKLTLQAQGRTFKFERNFQQPEFETSLIFCDIGRPK